MDERKVLRWAALKSKPCYCKLQDFEGWWRGRKESKNKKKWCVSVEWVVPGLKGRPGCFWLVLHLRRTTFLTNEHFNFLGKNKTRNKLPHDKYSTCSFIEFGAVPIIDIFLSDIKLWQSDGVHLHRVSRLPHKLQVVCGVANWRKEAQKQRNSETLLHTNPHKHRWNHITATVDALIHTQSCSPLQYVLAC